MSSQESNTEEKYELVFLLHYQIYSNLYSQYPYLKAQEGNRTPYQEIDWSGDVCLKIYPKFEEVIISLVQ